MRGFLLTLLLASACNAGGLDEECIFDADCDSGLACEASECVLACVSNDECNGGLVCRPGVNTASRVCRPPADDELNGELPDEPTSTSPTFAALVVESTATTTELCDLAEPGPDLFAVAVEDGASTVAWGLVEFASVTVDGNDHANSSVLDGAAPDTDPTTGCPEFDGHVVSLGCDGAFVVVSFVDALGDEVEVDPARHRVRVYEWGVQCDETALQDTFEARLCRNADEAFRGNLSSCSQLVIRNGTGESVGPSDPI